MLKSVTWIIKTAIDETRGFIQYHTYEKLKVETLRHISSPGQAGLVSNEGKNFK